MFSRFSYWPFKRSWWSVVYFVEKYSIKASGPLRIDLWKPHEKIETFFTHKTNKKEDSKLSP